MNVLRTASVTLVVLAVVLPGVACGGAVEDGTSAESTRSRATRVTEASPSSPKQTPTVPFPNAAMRPVSPAEIEGPKLPGYFHSLAKSKCSSLTFKANEVSANGDVKRYVADEGIFAETSNGYSAFSLNPGVQLQRSTPFPGGGQAHNSRVMAYFVGAGLPAEQVGAINTSALMMESGVVTQEEPISRTVLGHVAKLTRVIDRVPVAESFAAARFNGDDVLVSEQVWWPEVSATITADIAAFRSVLDDAKSASSFRASLPVQARDGQGAITIHHSLPLAQKWEEIVTWDVPVGHSVHHYNRLGNRVALRPSQD